MFVTDMTRWDEILAVHGAVFGEIRPAATLVEVGALIEPDVLDRDRGRGPTGLTATPLTPQA